MHDVGCGVLDYKREKSKLSDITTNEHSSRDSVLWSDITLPPSLNSPISEFGRSNFKNQGKKSNGHSHSHSTQTKDQTLFSTQPHTLFPLFGTTKLTITPLKNHAK